jgi:uncharacterized cupredoxin-like copper-binding protein
MLRLAAPALFLASLVAVALSGCNEKANTTRTVGIHFSRFEQETITVKAGTPITFTLRNDDPIAHEWIVGTDAVHERHRTGTEPFHDQIPSEVTIPALSTRKTVLTFNDQGEYRFICHLPGHEAYGMAGTLRVVSN